MLPLVLVLLVVAAVAAWLEARLQRELPRRAAEQLREPFGTDVEVTFQGSPILPHLLRRQVPAARLEAERVPIRGGRGHLDRLVIDVAELTLPRGEVGMPDRVPWRAATGSFEAWLGPDDLLAASGLDPLVRRVRIIDAGLRLGLPGGVWVDTTLQLREGDVVVEIDLPAVASLLPPLSALPRSRRIDLQDLPAGAHVEELDFHDDHLVLRGSLDGDRLEDPGRRR